MSTKEEAPGPVEMSNDEFYKQFIGTFTKDREAECPECGGDNLTSTLARYEDDGQEVFCEDCWYVFTILSED